MRTRETILMLFLFLFTTSLHAQKEVEKWNKKTNETNEQITAVDTTLQNTKETFNNLTETLGLGGLFGSRNTVVMGFTGIDYGDEKLSQIVRHFQGIKGVKDVTKLLNNGSVTIQLKSKSGPSQIWENLPQDLKSSFKVVEANEHAMLMHFKPSHAVPAGAAVVRESGREN